MAHKVQIILMQLHNTACNFWYTTTRKKDLTCLLFDMFLRSYFYHLKIKMQMYRLKGILIKGMIRDMYFYFQKIFFEF